LPVNDQEQKYLISFYVKSAFGYNGGINITSMGILLAHLLYHSRVVEAKCIEAISHRYPKRNTNNMSSRMGDVDEEEEERQEHAIKMKTLSKIMLRFQDLAPIASKLRQSRTMEAVTRKYQHAASEKDVLAALHDLMDPSSLIHETGANNYYIDMKDNDNDNDNDVDVDVEDAFHDNETKRNVPDPKKNVIRLGFHPSIAPLGSGSSKSSSNGLGTPKKSLLAVASSMGSAKFSSNYSPSMLSPVVQGSSPFASNNELSVKAKWQKATRSGESRITSSPSKRTRTVVLTTRKGSKLKQEREKEFLLGDQ
jgi:hypothetical protein